MLTRLKNLINAWRMRNHVKSMCRECIVDRHGLPPVMQFASNDFNGAWEQAIRNVLVHGSPITFGGNKEKKKALDTVQTIILNYNAADQILRKEIHPLFPFKMVDQYIYEFTTEFLETYLDAPENERFDYIYYDRLNRDSQICHMRNDLEKQITSDIISNRSQMITWIPKVDQYVSATPCLQRIRIRYEGDDNVSIHMDWRSRDLFNAWQVNLIGILNMIYREIVEPNDCRIDRIIDRNDSLHIYKSDIVAAANVIDYA